MAGRKTPQRRGERARIVCKVCGSKVYLAHGEDVPDAVHLVRHAADNAAHDWALSATIAAELKHLAACGQEIAEGATVEAHKVLCALGYAERVTERGEIAKHGRYARITAAGRRWLEMEREKRR